MNDLAALIGPNRKLDGGLIYYGHSTGGGLYVGEEPIPGTNLYATDLNRLSSESFEPGATIDLCGCFAGSGGGRSLTQAMANYFGVTTRGYTGPVSFTGTPGQRMSGPNARPAATGPL